jgi:mannose-6-phosphate isomerase-like protein (cupin superfamily)
MTAIRVIREKEVPSRPLPGAEEEAGAVKRIIYPPNVMTRGVFMGIGSANPGYSPHRWHAHHHDEAEGYEVDYPEDFEEIYFILNGSGLIQWKDEEGTIEEKEVGPGDTIFMPVGVPEHQLFNSGKEKMTILFCGSPTPRVTFKDSPKA